MAGRKWSGAEDQFVIDNPWSSSKELAKRFNRSVSAAERRIRQIRGTANRRFKCNWDKPSKELAYFLGALCSDAGIYKYKFSITQDKKNIAMLIKIEQILKKLFGLPYAKGIRLIANKNYFFVECYSTEFLKKFGTQQDIEVGRFKHDGEWMRSLNLKFGWVFKDKFFWYFIGGLYDGDGCLAIKKKVGACLNYPEVSIGIDPLESKLFLLNEFNEKGFVFKQYRGSIKIVLNGGRVKISEFLNKVKCVIPRKKVISHRSWKNLNTSIHIWLLYEKILACLVPIGGRSYGFGNK